MNMQSVIMALGFLFGVGVGYFLDIFAATEAAFAAVAFAFGMWISGESAS